MADPYHIVPPKRGKLPIVVSVPHCGIEIPPDVAKDMLPEMVLGVPDTDWYVHELYGFAPEMGLTLIHARYSRFVVDLNRDPEGKPLYTDQRLQTGLVPATTFCGKPIYKDAAVPDDKEIRRRTERYFRPYHAKVDELVRGLRAQFKHVLFWDAHSIKRVVESIRKEPFPDMILGDQKGKTAHATLSETAKAALGRAKHQVAHNDPFMGGFLTRRVGQPAQGIHALQLEMTQDLYMDEARSRRDIMKQAAIRDVLAGTMEALVKALETLP